MENGGVTSPLGFSAGGANAGIKSYGSEPRRDVGLLRSDRACVAAGVFTRNRIVGAPVRVSRERLADGCAQAIVVNSGCSNVALGELGRRDAEQMAALAGEHLGLPSARVLVASTGVIARRLPLDRIESGVKAIEPSPDGGLEFSRAIMTTDRVPKRCARQFELGGRRYVIGGTAKGSGMARPDMATVLGFLTTDAPLELSFARFVLRQVTDLSFNMLNIDLDTSTSDSLFLLAGGQAGGEPIHASHSAAGAFVENLHAVCESLTKALARDGEGARTLIEVTIEGARTLGEARRAAHVVVSSPLVKTMVAGRDPNVGRVLMAIGRADVQLDDTSLTVHVNGVQAYSASQPQLEREGEVRAALEAERVEIVVHLRAGTARAVAWGCDLTEEYVRINADYTT